MRSPILRTLVVVTMVLGAPAGGVRGQQVAATELVVVPPAPPVGDTRGQFGEIAGEWHGDRLSPG